jgi:hypothetical protein
VLEPRQGGDARAEAAGLFLVEQYKTRSHGTWSVADLEPVLRDLRKAVPRVPPPAYARYRFVTDAVGRAVWMPSLRFSRIFAGQKGRMISMIRK